MRATQLCAGCGRTAVGRTEQALPSFASAAAVASTRAQLQEGRTQRSCTVAEARCALLCEGGHQLKHAPCDADKAKAHGQLCRPPWPLL